MSAEWLLFLLAISMIIIPGSHAGPPELSIPDSSSVTERTMKSILESCYHDDSLTDPFVVAGDFNEFTDKLPMIRMNFEKPRYYTLPNFKLTRVIIICDSFDDLLPKIGLLKQLRSWNHMALFFIIGKNDLLCGGDAYSFIYITWNLNMINTIYICPESKNTSLLYTANRYADYAPHPWRPDISIIDDMRENSKKYPLNYFIQRFDKNLSCSSLHYDKTIKLGQSYMMSIVWGPQSDYMEFFNEGFSMKKDFIPLKIIEATTNLLNIDRVLSRGSTKESAIETLSQSQSDLTIRLTSIEEFPSTKSLFPHSQKRIVAVIKSNPEKLMHRKYLYLSSIFIILLVFIALVILFAILSWKNHEFSPMFLVSSIFTIIRSNMFRIIFTTIMIIMIINNGVFLSEMATFLTARREKISIERIETLVQLGYKFYSTSDLEQLIELYCPECQAMIVEQDECFEYILDDELTACLTDESIYQNVAFMLFDVVREPLFQTLMVTKCRDDWPLYDRMNDMWMRFFESGLQKFWETQQSYRSLRERLIQNIGASSTEYQAIKLNELMFAFKFLAIGLSLSVLVFIAELLIKKYRILT